MDDQSRQIVYPLLSLNELSREQRTVVKSPSHLAGGIFSAEPLRIPAPKASYFIGTQGILTENGMAESDPHLPAAGRVGRGTRGDKRIKKHPN